MHQDYCMSGTFSRTQIQEISQQRLQTIRQVKTPLSQACKGFATRHGGLKASASVLVGGHAIMLTAAFKRFETCSGIVCQVLWLQGARNICQAMKPHGHDFAGRGDC